MKKEKWSQRSGNGCHFFPKLEIFWLFQTSCLNVHPLLGKIPNFDEYSSQRLKPSPRSHSYYKSLHIPGGAVFDWQLLQYVIRIYSYPYIIYIHIYTLYVYCTCTWLGLLASSTICNLFPSNFSPKNLGDDGKLLNLHLSISLQPADPPITQTSPTSHPWGMHRENQESDGWMPRNYGTAFPQLGNNVDTLRSWENNGATAVVLGGICLFKEKHAGVLILLTWCY